MSGEARRPGLGTAGRTAVCDLGITCLCDARKQRLRALSSTTLCLLPFTVYVYLLFFVFVPLSTFTLCFRRLFSALFLVPSSTFFALYLRLLSVLWFCPFICVHVLPYSQYFRLCLLSTFYSSMFSFAFCFIPSASTFYHLRRQRSLFLSISYLVVSCSPPSCAATPSSLGRREHG